MTLQSLIDEWRRLATVNRDELPRMVAGQPNEAAWRLIYRDRADIYQRCASELASLVGATRQGLTAERAASAGDRVEGPASSSASVDGALPGLGNAGERPAPVTPGLLQCEVGDDGSVRCWPTEAARAATADDEAAR